MNKKQQITHFILAACRLCDSYNAVTLCIANLRKCAAFGIRLNSQWQTLEKRKPQQVQPLHTKVQRADYAIG